MTSRWNPDPGRGVFETVLVAGGAPVALEAHLARMDASLENLYGTRLPTEAQQLVARRAAGLELGRLRLTVAPSDSGAGLTYEVETGSLDRSLHFPTRRVALRPLRVSRGLGCHKWVDRGALPASAPNEAPLLVDRDEVLEVAWANVFAVRQGALFTPPLDERILPGVTRATMIELAIAREIEVIEDVLSLEALSRADEVFLTNSIRGVESVDSVAGVPLAAESPVTQLLGDALAREWGQTRGTVAAV